MIYFNVLNLVISGIPSIPSNVDDSNTEVAVLNLVISGIPSILNLVLPICFVLYKF